MLSHHRDNLAFIACSPGQSSFLINQTSVFLVLGQTLDRIPYAVFSMHRHCVQFNMVIVLINLQISLPILGRPDFCVPHRGV